MPASSRTLTHSFSAFAMRFPPFLGETNVNIFPGYQSRAKVISGFLTFRNQDRVRATAAEIQALQAHLIRVPCQSTRNRMLSEKRLPGGSAPVKVRTTSRELIDNIVSATFDVSLKSGQWVKMRSSCSSSWRRVDSHMRGIKWSLVGSLPRPHTTIFAEMRVSGDSKLS